jgi:polypeptide N-acetylgalactosaminyltransferase
MDEYKEYIYQRKPERFSRVDAGDISKQLAIKHKLQCKPFKYFLEVVAPDMLEKYPPVQIEFASGTVCFQFFFLCTYLYY